MYYCNGWMVAEQEFIRRKIQITTYSVNILGDYKLLLWGDGQAAPPSIHSTPPPPTPPLLLRHEDIKHTENAYIKRRTAQEYPLNHFCSSYSLPPQSHLVCLLGKDCNLEQYIPASLRVLSLSPPCRWTAHNTLIIIFSGWLSVGPTPRPKEVQYSRSSGRGL